MPNGGADDEAPPGHDLEGLPDGGGPLEEDPHQHLRHVPPRDAPHRHVALTGKGDRHPLLPFPPPPPGAQDDLSAREKARRVSGSTTVALSR